MGNILKSRKSTSKGFQKGDIETDGKLAQTEDSLSEYKVLQMQTTECLQDENIQTEKVVAVIEIAETYTRHLLQYTGEENEIPFEVISEKHPYCFERAANGTVSTLGKEARSKYSKLTRLEKNRFFYIENISKRKNIKTVLRYIFTFHHLEIQRHLENIDGEETNKDCKRIIVLPRHSSKQFILKVKEAASQHGHRNYVVGTSDALASFFNSNVMDEECMISNRQLPKEVDSFALAHIDYSLGQVQMSLYSKVSRTICRQNRERIDLISQDNLKFFLQELFGREFWVKYKMAYPDNDMSFHQSLDKEFKKNIYIAGDKFVLEYCHLFFEAEKYYMMSVKAIVARSKFKEFVMFDEETYTLALSVSAVNHFNVRKTLTKFLGNKYSQNYSPLIITSDQCVEPIFQEDLQQALSVVKSGLFRMLTHKGNERIYPTVTCGVATFDERRFVPMSSRLDKQRHFICLDAEKKKKTNIWCFKRLLKKGLIEKSPKIIWKELVTFYSLRRKAAKHQSLIFRSNSSYPRYVNEEGCEVAATIQVNPPAEGWPDEVEFEYTLTSTNKGPLIEVTDLKSGVKHMAELIESRIKEIIVYLGDPRISVLKGAISLGINTNGISLLKIANSSYSVNYIPDTKTMKKRDQLKLQDMHGTVMKHGVDHELIKMGQLLHHGQIFSWNVQENCVPDHFVGAKVFSLHSSSRHELANICPEPPSPNGWHEWVDWEVQLIVEDIGFTFKVINKDTGRERMEYIPTTKRCTVFSFDKSNKYNSSVFIN